MMKKVILTAAVFLAMAVPALADTMTGSVWVNVTDSQSLTVKTEKGLKVFRYVPSATCTPTFWRPNDTVKVNYHFDEKTKTNVADGIEVLHESTNYSREMPVNVVDKAAFMSAVEKGDAVIIDVRGPAKYKNGHFKGAKNIPLWTIEARLKEIPKDKTVIFYCSSGKMSRVAADIVKEHGYDKVGFLRMSVMSTPENGGAKIVEHIKVKCG